MAVKEPGADGLLEGALECRSPGSTWYAMGAGSGLSSASFFRTASEKRLLFSSSSTMSVSWTILHIQGWSQTVGLDAGKGKGNATGPLPVKRVLSCIALAQRDILHKLSQTAGLILLIFFMRKVLCSKQPGHRRAKQSGCSAGVQSSGGGGRAERGWPNWGHHKQVCRRHA